VQAAFLTAIVTRDLYPIAVLVDDKLAACMLPSTAAPGHKRNGAGVCRGRAWPSVTSYIPVLQQASTHASTQCWCSPLHLRFPCQEGCSRGARRGTWSVLICVVAELQIVRLQAQFHHALTASSCQLTGTFGASHPSSHCSHYVSSGDRLPRVGSASWQKVAAEACETVSLSFKHALWSCTCVDRGRDLPRGCRGSCCTPLLDHSSTVSFSLSATNMQSYSRIQMSGCVWQGC
jgi:hypothetical protein